MQLNPKFESLPGEFVHREVCWGNWTDVDLIKNIEENVIFNNDDVLVASYPNSGTTVLQEIVWLVLNDANTKVAKEKDLIYRCPFLEEKYELDYKDYNYRGYIAYGTDSIPRPRFMKTHLLFRNLKHHINKTPGMKILVPLRNPKDNAVSLFHFYQGLKDYGPYKGTWNEFFERWIDGWIVGGDWLDVTTEWWSARSLSNIKIVFFEDIVYKKKEVIKEVCEFLDKKLSDSQIDQIIKYTDFQSMRENPSTNFSIVEEFKHIFTDDFQFMRKGEVGDWKHYFDDDQIRRMDEKYRTELENSGLKFRYE